MTEITRNLLEQQIAAASKQSEMLNAVMARVGG
jgi:hypothetical protein